MRYAVNQYRRPKRLVPSRWAVAATRCRAGMPAAVLGVVLGGFGPASAWPHHGAAAYDREARVEVEGTVRRFAWVNPHALIDIETRTAAGALERWTAETAGLVILARAGWSRDTLLPGARVKLVGFPARNRSNTMILERLVLEGGHELTNFVP